MKRTIMTMALVAATNMALYAKTLVVYYSYTNNVHNLSLIHISEPTRP